MKKIDEVRLFEGIAYIDPAFIEDAGEPLKRRRSNLIWLRKAGALAASFVFAAALLLSINAAFPAFAESLPLIGEIFRQLNSIGSHAPSYDGVVQAVGESAENDQYKATVTEAYCDGEYIFFALRLQAKDTRLLKMESLQTEESTNGSSAPGWQITLNGESGGLVCDLPYFTRRGAYFESNPIKAALPDSIDPNTPIKVEAIIGNLSGRTQEAKGETGQIISIEPVYLSFELTVNTRYNRQNQVSNAEIDGLMLQDWSCSPSKLSVTFAYPYFSAAGVYAGARTDNGLDLGEDLREFGDFGDGRYSPGDAAVQTCSFTGPPDGTKKVIATVYKDPSHDRTAGTSVFGEFTINLETGEVTVTDDYLNAGFVHLSIKEYEDTRETEGDNSVETIAPSRSPVPKMPQFAKSIFFVMQRGF